MSIEAYLDTREVAVLLGVTISEVNRLCARGTLASTWHAGRRLIRRDAVRAYLDDKEAQARRRSNSGQKGLGI